LSVQWSYPVKRMITKSDAASERIKESGAILGSPEPVGGNTDHDPGSVTEDDQVEKVSASINLSDPLVRLAESPSHLWRVPFYLFQWLKWTAVWFGAGALCVVYADLVFGNSENTVLGLGLLYLMLSTGVWWWYGWNLTARRAGFPDGLAREMVFRRNRFWRVFDGVVFVGLASCCAAFVVSLLNVTSPQTVVFGLNLLPFLVALTVLWFVGKTARYLSSKFTSTQTQLSETEISALHKRVRASLVVSLCCAVLGSFLFGLLGLGINGKSADVSFLSTGALVMLSCIWCARKLQTFRQLKFLSLSRENPKREYGRYARSSALVFSGALYGIVFVHVTQLGANYYRQRAWAQRYETQLSADETSLQDLTAVRNRDVATLQAYFNQCNDLLPVLERRGSALSKQNSLLNEAEKLPGLRAPAKDLIASRKALLKIESSNQRLLRDEANYCNQMRLLPSERQEQFYKSSIIPALDSYKKLGEEQDRAQRNLADRKRLLKSSLLVAVFRNFHPSIYDVFRVSDKGEQPKVSRNN
jgi:hypothetical protein